ncbi:hypothetical protein LOTGIDRAFT_168332 [Lottia gigantea]|uniref:Calponin-homology (CH) domain-containing protein n=1 Tax=Lottia gigantea TaxID=225164 RepID=V3Z2N9_LOTGI|nr:hypothetical protein LOTGIDRAFT_168332 [Lottia gigantea]ESO84843.1 hypothetical protein LOTGIDRAFT_168332 [Lottia gigantea]
MLQVPQGNRDIPSIFDTANDKIKDIKLKPKNSAQMVDNINACLSFLSSLGVCVEGISAKDIKEGNLKAILGLFFSLSRYKQQQKSQLAAQKSAAAEQDRINQTPTPQHSHLDTGQSGQPSHPSTAQLNGGEALSRLPSPFKNNNKNSANTPTKDSQGSNVPVSNANVSSRKQSSQGAHSTSNEKARSHQNQQNNILQVTSATRMSIFYHLQSQTNPKYKPKDKSGFLHKQNPQNQIDQNE